MRKIFSEVTTVPSEAMSFVSLEGKMVFPSVEDHAVGIIVPAATRAGMELIAIQLRVVIRCQCITRRTDPYLPKRRAARLRHLLSIHRGDFDLLSLQRERFDRIGREPEGLIALWQSDREVLHQLVAVVDAE